MVFFREGCYCGDVVGIEKTKFKYRILLKVRYWLYRVFQKCITKFKSIYAESSNSEMCSNSYTLDTQT